MNEKNGQTQLTIEITGGVEAAQSIAIVPFGITEGADISVDVASIISDDLARTGKFKPLPTHDLLEQQTTHEAVDLRDFRLLGVNNLLIGQVFSEDTGVKLIFTLFDVFRGNEVISQQTLTSSAINTRYLAHQAADLIYEKLTGQPGVAATRIAYISSSSRHGGEQQTTALKVADADGYHPQTIVSTGEPLVSPTWSPDGQQIAYVSFENKRPAIYLQELSTGRREIIASYPGLNSSPAFSPDGNHLALTLSKDGNPEIYLFDLSNRQLTRLTEHFAIDTEPAWSPDGKFLLFTSNRGGSPQIYRMLATGGPAERISQEGDYNARASYAPDGRSIVMVTRIKGNFRIALFDLERRTTRLLTTGPLDESPSFAPNGALVIYATQHAGHGVLATVAVSGGSNQRFSQESSQVREPAWSPLNH